MRGVLIASIGSGQLIAAPGGTRCSRSSARGSRSSGCCFLSRLGVGTSSLAADLYMLVLGLGLGFVMQVLVLAVQNAVEYANLGVATSTATLFRSMGGTIGVPIFGAIFANQLASNLRAAAARSCGKRAASARAEPDRRAAPGDPRALTSRPRRRRSGRSS